MRISPHTLQLAIPVAAIGMRLASQGTASASYLVLAGYALLGRAQAIQALALAWLFNMLNSRIAPAVSYAAVGRYAVIFAAALSVLLLRSGKRAPLTIGKLTFGTLALGIFIIGHSLLFSRVTDVSILKGVAWTLVAVTLLEAWSALSSAERAKLEQRLFGGLTLLILGSVPLAFSSIGYLRQASEFRGLLDHSQALGPTAAFLGSWLAALVLESPRPRWRDIVLLGLCLGLVVLSGARTAGFALVLGLGVAVLMSAGRSRLTGRRAFPGLASPRLHLLLLLIAMGVVLAGAALYKQLAAFVVKHEATESLVESATVSRGEQVQGMLENIADHPVTGIGFGVASDLSSFRIQRDPVLNLPVGAVVEKGVLPIAVLEELGILGFVFWLVWVWTLALRGLRSGVAAFAVLLVVLFTNLGEATLFSPGGMGLLPIILLTWAATSRAYLPRRTPLGSDLVLAAHRHAAHDGVGQGVSPTRM